MRARVGDLLVADGAGGHRVCEIIRLSHPDGSPPYVVRWLRDGHLAMLFPGPYTRLVRQPEEKDAELAPPPDAEARQDEP